MSIRPHRKDGERANTQRGGGIRMNRPVRQVVGPGSESKRGIEDRRASDEPLKLRVQPSQLIPAIPNRNGQQRMPGAMSQLMKPPLRLTLASPHRPKVGKPVPRLDPL